MRKVVIEVPDKCGLHCPLAQATHIAIRMSCYFRDMEDKSPVMSNGTHTPIKACGDAEVSQ